MWECQPQMRKKVETCRHFLVRQIRVFHAFCHLDPPHPVERGVSYGYTEESADAQLAMGCPPPGKPGITPWGKCGFSNLSHSVLALCWNFLYNGACCQGGEKWTPPTANPCVRRRIEPERNLLLEPMRAQNFIARGNGPVGPSEHMLHRYLYKTT